MLTVPAIFPVMRAHTTQLTSDPSDIVHRALTALSTFEEYADLRPVLKHDIAESPIFSRKIWFQSIWQHIGHSSETLNYCLERLFGAKLDDVR